jgi:hypothetical protein
MEKPETVDTSAMTRRRGESCLSYGKKTYKTNRDQEEMGVGERRLCAKGGMHACMPSFIHEME